MCNLHNRVEDMDTLQKMRLSVAAKIAGGMCANKENMRMSSWEAEIARASLSVADKLIHLVTAGGL
jgi:hypothetical protein